MQLQKSTTYRLKKKKQRDYKAAEELKPNKHKSTENLEGTKAIVAKEFIWDRIVTVLVTCMVGLTVVDLIAEFFSQTSSNVICKTPNSFTVVQSSFVNSFCFGSLSSSQYYPLFLTIHGLVIMAPQQLWSWLFAGYMDFFFDLAKSLDRLKDPRSGEYDRKNFAIVTKLESAFAQNYKIYGCYLGKLLLQLVAAFASLIVSWGVFRNFSIVFPCSSNATSTQYTVEDDNFSNAWPTAFECTYIPFQLFSILRYVDTVLIIMVIIVLLYGIGCCIKGHPAELGASEVAMFAFTSCLPPESYVFPKLCATSGLCQLGSLLSPPIKNDLDFLLLRLYQSDSGHGKMFRELQVSKVYRTLYIHDHELLHLLINLQQDWRDNRDAMERRLRTCHSRLEEASADTKQQQHLELKEYFRNSIAIYKNPELAAYDDYREDLGNIDLNGIEWINIQSVRTQFYEYIKCAPHLRTEDGYGYALDISFGTAGFTLALARAFEKVRLVNFHPFYQDDMPKRNAFYTNYDCITLPQDVMSRSNIVLNKAYEYICHGISRKKVLNFIVVGPIDDRSKQATVNLLISHLIAAECIQTNAMLLAIRPLRIAHRSTAEAYFKYEPSKPIFVGLDPSNVHTVPVNCAGTKCTFEFSAYSFLGDDLNNDTSQYGPTGAVIEK